MKQQKSKVFTLKELVEREGKQPKIKCRYSVICNGYKKYNVTCNDEVEASSYCGMRRLITEIIE